MSSEQPVSPDFIQISADALSAAECAQLIQRFNASGTARRGHTGGGVDTALKDSWDICISDYAEWKDAENMFNTAMLHHLMAYVRSYPYTVLAPLALRMPDPVSGEPVLLDEASITGLSDSLLQTLLIKVFRPGTINIQRYVADEGGYPYWHCEVYPKLNDADTLSRVLLWTVYLNDDFNEGETEFLHQRCKVVPQTGAMLIAPAGFTHTHRGNKAKGGDKYIATSWVLFQSPEKIFGGGAS